MAKRTPKVRQLGRAVELPQSPEDATLERVPNPHPDKVYLARFTAPEFTSLCPVTGQPDFAHLVIDYVPRKWLVESKSLQLYLGSYRNHGAFHEDCISGVCWAGKCQAPTCTDGVQNGEEGGVDCGAAVDH